MVCVLLNKDDLPGIWLSRALVEAGRKDIKLVSAEELVYAPSFSCGFRSGKAFFDIRLANGLEFADRTVGSVLNRISYLPDAHIHRFKNEDREYVATEMNATFTFLFSILPGQQFNGASGQGFSGRNRSALQWKRLAQQAGFYVQELIYQHKNLDDSIFHSNLPCRLLYFNGKCYSGEAEIPPDLAETAQLLGRLSGEKILEIFYRPATSGFFFETASTQPSFQNPGLQFITDLQNQI